MTVGTVRLHAVALENAEHACAALVAADLPDVVDGVAGLVHIHNRLLAVQPKRGLGPFLLVLLPGTEDPGLSPARRSGLRRNAADCVKYVTDRRLWKEFVLGINPVVDGDQPDLVLAAQVQERTEFPYSPQCIA